MKGKLKFITGLKGLCALVVFCHHFTLTFYSGSYYGETVPKMTSTGFEYLFSYKPYGVILNGNFAVCIFITITGFLYAYKVFCGEYKNKDLFLVCLRRFLKLSIPCLIVGIIYNLIDFAINKHVQISFFEFIGHILLYQWFTVDGSILSVLWPMKYFFLGSIISLFISNFSSPKRWYSPIIYMYFALGVRHLDPYFSSIFLGVALADIFYYKRINLLKIRNNFLLYFSGIIFIFAGLLFGGYPSYVIPTDGIYFVILNYLKTNYINYHVFGSFCFLLGLVIIPKINILESKILCFYGDISLEIFLLHGVILAFTKGPVFSFINSCVNRYSFSCFLVFCIEIIIVTFLSIVYKKYISNRTNKLIDKITT